MPASVFSRGYQRLFQTGRSLAFDWLTPLCLLCLGAVSVILIRSAHLYSGGSFWKKQVFWLLLGAIAYVAVSRLNYKVLLEKALWIYLFGLFLLGLVLWSPLGLTIYGAKRWINLGFMNLQPTELAKIATLIMLASILARHRVGDIRDSLRVLALVGATSALPFLLIFLQPDLGSTLVFPPMVFALLYVSRLSERFFVAAFALFLLAVALVGFDIYRYYHFLEQNGLDPRVDTGHYEKQSLLPLQDYQRNRILSFVAPELVDPQGIGVAWNGIQARISVSTGGLAGKGIGKGTQAQLGYLPQSVAHNDFIFAVLAEETGFFGSALIIGLYALIIGNGFRIAGLARDPFGMLLAVGVSVLFLVHAFINIGMAIGITPITGLPLPLLSYGGSFVLSCCLLQGLVQSVYIFRKDFT